MADILESVESKVTTQSRSRSQLLNDAIRAKPCFLKKLNCMISNCPPDISCWSDDGKYFIVKDSERLATEIIPKFWKHNKFLCFERQLIFCKYFLNSLHDVYRHLLVTLKYINIR